VNHAEFILDQLRRTGRFISAPKGRSWITVRCVFSEKHKRGDQTPSLRVCPDGHLNTPAKCWSCNTKTSWNEIAALIGADPIPGSGDDPVTDYDATQEFRSLASTFDEMADKDSLGLPTSMIEPWVGDFVRNGKVICHENTLKRLPSYRWFDPGKSGGVYITERILWPILIRGMSYGYTGRALDPKVTHRWQNSENFKATRLLFPYDLLPKTKVAILVEGPTSALRLVNRGLPAVCIFGAGNWDKDYKIPLLVQKGVTIVIMAFDGDPAGRKAHNRIAADLEQHFDVYRFPIPEGKDPANMKSSLVKALRHHVRVLRREADAASSHSE